MDEFEIIGGNKLYGEINIMAAKNAVLPIIACCIMIRDKVVLHNCERLADILNMAEIVNSIGGKCYFEESLLIIDCSNIDQYIVNEDLTQKLRSSVFILGSLVSAMKRAEISYPGGCDIGLRPIDLHIFGLKKVGIDIKEEDGKIKCCAQNIIGANINLDFPSVGATENIIMAATLAKGRTVLYNAATEPEIVDLQNFINSMGGRVTGAGSSVVVIDGVKKLHGGEYTPIGDRIAAGTYLIAGATCGGSVAVNNVRPECLKSLSEKLAAAGATVIENGSSVRVDSLGKLRAINKIETQPYPGFPTDLQAPMTAMLCVASGTSVVVENLFENRFKYTVQLRKMGGDISVCGKAAVIRGRKLKSADVIAEDLRGGAALAISGLVAEGKTRIGGIKHIDRGYYYFDEKLRSLGGMVKRLKKS